MCSPWEQTEKSALCRTEPLLRKQLLEDRTRKTNVNFPQTRSAPKPKFHHTYPRKDSFEEAREKAVRHALTDTSLHIRLTETHKYLEPQLAAEWWERCVHQTPPREWLKTGDCHTSQDLKRRISLQLKRLWCTLMALWLTFIKHLVDYLLVTRADPDQSVRKSWSATRPLKGQT